MLIQSFISKLSDLAKSSRFLFFIAFITFGLIQASDSGKKPAPIKSTNQFSEIVRMNVNQRRALKNAQWKILGKGPVVTEYVPGAKICPPWPD